MPADEQITAQEHNQPTAAQQQSAKQARSRQSDDGPEILPCMEHFVTLVRKATIASKSSMTSGTGWAAGGETMVVLSPSQIGGS